MGGNVDGNLTALPCKTPALGGTGQANELTTESPEVLRRLGGLVSCND